MLSAWEGLLILIQGPKNEDIVHKYPAIENEQNGGQAWARKTPDR